MAGLSPVEVETLLLSLRVAIWSVIISLPFGIMAAWMLSRRQFFGQIVIDGLIHLPLVMPPVVVGYLLEN